MKQCYLVLVIVLHYLICLSSADILKKPKTNIIEAIDKEVVSEVNEAENFKKSSSELCPESEDKDWKDLTSRSDIDALSPELQLPLNNVASKDLAYQNAYNPGYNYYDINTDPLSSLPPKIPENSIVRSYNRIPYPYIYPDFFTSFQPYPVGYLPPVFLKYYYSLLPQDMLPNYDLSNIRTPRVLRSNDDFWEQLESASIMKNILPTMPVPFLRDTNPPSPYEIAYFPSASPYCALPVMFGITPKVLYRDRFANYNREVDPQVEKNIHQNG